MGDTKGSSGFRNSPGSGKQAFLPPKSPFPTVPPSYVDYSSTQLKGMSRPREGHRHHQRTSSESFLIEEQPSWLDDLLNEPETPVRRGAHRRSSSDSFAYVDMANLSFDNLAQDGRRNRSIALPPSWGSGEFDYPNDSQHPAYYVGPNSFGGSHRGRESALNTVTYPSSSHLLAMERVVHPGSSSAVKESSLMHNVAEKQEKEETSQEQNDSFERKEGSQGKYPQSETDNKRAKQQFAQRSRVRKLQYIAELESNVHALQAEGLEVTAELEFLNQQNLMLDLENKALKQRLDSLAQEHIIKCLQHEMLEREIARLRALLFHQQQQHQQQHLQQQQQQHQRPISTHSRRNSRDLDSQFSDLSLKPKGANSEQDPVTGQLRI